MIAIGDSKYGIIQIYDRNLVLVKSFQEHNDKIFRIKQSPYSDKIVATCSKDKTVKIWQDWTLKHTYTGHTEEVRAIEFIDLDTIASGSADETIKIWSISTGLTKKIIQNPGLKTCSLKFLGNGLDLAAGFSNGVIYIYKMVNKVIPLIGHTNSVNDLALISNFVLASSSNDYTVIIWSLTTNKLKYVLYGHTKYVFGLKLIDGVILASASQDKTICFWNTTNGSLVKTISGQTDEMFWSIDTTILSNVLVSGAKDKKIMVWNLTTYTLTGTSTDTGLEITSLAVLNASINSTSKLKAFSYEKF